VGAFLHGAYRDRTGDLRLAKTLKPEPINGFATRETATSGENAATDGPQSTAVDR
jgi:hypothetical protein